MTEVPVLVLFLYVCILSGKKYITLRKAMFENYTKRIRVYSKVEYE